MRDGDDQQEYEPYGEHSSVPDHRLESDEGRVGELGAYPSAEGAQPRTCVSCGTELPDVQGRTKCRHCLEQGIDPLDADADPTSGAGLEWQFQQLQFAVVPGETKYIAAARGATALKRAGDQTRAVDRVEPIYDFSEDVADVIADRWGGNLPGVTRLDTEQGQRFVATVRATPDEVSEPPRDVSGIPWFVDATGEAIGVDADLSSTAIEADPVLDAPDVPPVWLMPAWTLQRQGASSSFGNEIVREQECERCGHFTGHEYVDLLTVPAPYQSAGIWECSHCRARTLGFGDHAGQSRQKLRQDRSTRPRTRFAPHAHSWESIDSSDDEDDWDTEFLPGEVIDPEIKPDI